MIRRVQLCAVLLALVIVCMAGPAFSTAGDWQRVPVTRDWKSGGGSKREVVWQWLIRPKYKAALGFAEGLWGVVNDLGQLGFVDSSDRTVVAFRPAGGFYSGFCEGRAALEVSPDSCAMIDRAGNVLIAPREGISFGSDSGRLIPFYDKNSGKFGFMDMLGTVRLPAIYRNCQNFDDGMTWVQSGDLWVVSPAYREHGDIWHNNIIFRSASGLLGVMDRSGKVLLPPRYSLLNPGGDRNAPLSVVIDGKFALLDANLKYIAPPERQLAAGADVNEVVYYDGGMAFVLDEAGRYCALNERGEQLFSFPADVGVKPVYPHNGYGVLIGFDGAAVGNGMFIVNRRGEMVLPVFEGLLPFEERIVPVQLGGRWGLVRFRDEQ